MPTLRYATLFKAAVLAVLAADIIERVNSFVGISNGSTVTVLILNLFVASALLLLAKRTGGKNSVAKPAYVVLSALLIWSGIALLRGALVAPDYWAWKALLVNHVFFYLMTLAMLIGAHLRYFRSLVAVSLHVILPLALLSIPVTLTYDSELFQRIAMPVYLLLLLLPEQKRGLAAGH